MPGMLVAHVLFLAALAAIALGVLVTLGRIVRGADKRLLLTQTRGALCDAPDGRGISVLCSGASGPEGVRELLNVGYPRYEAVVVLDGMRRPDVFAAIVAEYRMIEVDFHPTGELPVEGVRALYRSRKRHFRRLVLIDKGFTSRRDDWEAAVGVAIYDYVLPLHSGINLSPFCIGRLAAELSLVPSGTVDLVRSMIGKPLLLIARDTVVAAGGFGSGLVRSIPRARRITLYEPLLREAGPASCRRGRCGIVAWLLAAFVVATAVAGWWEVCAVLLTMGVVVAAAEYARTYQPDACALSSAPPTDLGE